MRILGIDPGYGITGYSIIDYIGNKFRLIASGAIKTPANMSFPLRLSEIFTDVNTLIGKRGNFSCTVVKEEFLLMNIHLFR